MSQERTDAVTVKKEFLKEKVRPFVAQREAGRQVRNMETTFLSSAISVRNTDRESFV